MAVTTVEKKKVPPAAIIIPTAFVLGGTLFFVLRGKGQAAPPPPPPGMATIFGKVKDADTGQTVAGAIITLDTLGTVSEVDGSYLLTEIGPGSYQITVERDGYDTFSQPLELEEGTYELNISLNPKPAVILELASIDVLSINGIPFSEVGSGQITYTCPTCGGTGKRTYYYYGYGYYEVDCGDCGGTGQITTSGTWARLSKKIVANTLIGAVTVKMYNKSIRLSDSTFRDLGLHIFYQMSGGPSLTGRAGVKLYRDEQGYPYRNPPFDFSVKPSSAIGAGSWSPKVYSAMFRPFAQYYETAAGSATLGSFYVLDFLECTGSGNITV